VLCSLTRLTRSEARVLETIAAGRTQRQIAAGRSVSAAVVDDARATFSWALTPIKSDAQAFVRFDGNRYSVPTDRGERVLTIVADDRTVRLVDGMETLAEHRRSPREPYGDARRGHGSRRPRRRRAAQARTSAARAGETSWARSS